MAASKTPTDEEMVQFVLNADISLIVHSDVVPNQATKKASVLKHMFDLATLFWREKKLNEAKDICNKALAIDNADVNCNMRLAAILHSEGNIADAERAYRFTLTLNSGHPNTLANLSSLLIEKGDYVEAEIYCRQAIAAQSSNVQSLTILGRCLRKQRKHHEAEKTYRQVLEIEPCRSTVVCNLASLLIDRGEHTEAGKILTRLLNFNPDDRRALKRLGSVLEYRKDYVGAAKINHRWIKEASEKDGMEAAIQYQKMVRKIRNCHWSPKSHMYQHHGIRRAVTTMYFVAERLRRQPDQFLTDTTRTGNAIPSTNRANSGNAPSNANANTNVHSAITKSPSIQRFQQQQQPQDIDIHDHGNDDAMTKHDRDTLTPSINSKPNKYTAFQNMYVFASENQTNASAQPLTNHHHSNPHHNYAAHSIDKEAILQHYYHHHNGNPKFDNQLPQIPIEIWGLILQFLKGKDFLHVHILPRLT